MNKNLMTAGLILGLGTSAIIAQTNVSNACEDQLTTKEVACSVLNLRSGASTQHSIVAKLTKGTKVSVFYVKNGWAKVAIGTKVGFVSDTYLKTVSNNHISTQKYTVKVNGSLNVRIAPSMNSKVAGYLKNGTTVNVIAINNGWAKIKTNVGERYVSAKYLVKGVVSTNQTTTSKPENSTTISMPVAGNSFVNVNNLRMRDENGRVICLLKKGTKIDIVSDKGDYVGIKLQNGKVAYVYKNYVSTETEKVETTTPNLGHDHNSICGNNEALVVDYDAKISRDNVCLMKAPCYSAAEGEPLRFGEGVHIVQSVGNGWYRVVSYSGAEGFLNFDDFETK